MSKRILITGGAGFIGSALIRELLQFNHEIFVIDNLSFGNRQFISAIPDSHFFEADILNKENVEAIVDEVKPQWVVHLAAVHFIPYCNQHPYESANINIQGTMHVLDALRNCKTVQKVFFASTAAVYPIYDHAVSEDMPVAPLDIYGLSKLTGEHLCSEFHLHTGIPTFVGRLFNAFGPNETNPHLIPEIQKQILEGKRIINLGNLQPKRDFIHTYDMSRAIRLLMESEINKIETFNLGRGIEYSVTEIVEAFERELGEKITIEVDPARVRKSERMHLLADVTKVKEATGWEPEWDIDRGIRTLLTDGSELAK